jgi:ABC-type Fe3+ transport system permease subunit
MSQAAAISASAPPIARRTTRWEFWGRMLVLPYLVVFVVFVLYPVGYGLWLARDPQSYARLFDDPIFFRTAVNTVIQGSAADLIKLAMINIHRRLKKEQHPGRMLLQIHDELVFEVPEAEASSLQELVREEMQQAMQKMCG